MCESNIPLSSCHQILREINFRESRGVKTAVFEFLEALNDICSSNVNKRHAVMLELLYKARVLRGTNDEYKT